MGSHSSKAIHTCTHIHHSKWVSNHHLLLRRDLRLDWHKARVRLELWSCLLHLGAPVRSWVVVIHYKQVVKACYEI